VFGLLAGLTLAAPLAAQGVMIAPTAIFIDHRTRSGAVTLYNPNTEPAEVTVSLIYGYPVTDSAGTITLYAPEAPDSTEPSAAAWLQAFPRRLTVMPRERQTVRLLARPPASLPDGEYWARLVVTARAGQIPVSGIPDTAQIQVGLNLEVRSLLGVYYRKGRVASGVRIAGLGAELVQDTLVVRPALERLGNAAFLGTIRGALVDSTGATKAQLRLMVAVPRMLAPRLTAYTGVLPPGRYQLRLEVLAEREDLGGAVLRAPPARATADVVVP
jgi:hypothetical protein